MSGPCRTHGAKSLCIFHFAADHNLGNTTHGTYMCEAAAKAAGDRAAENERHP